MRRTRRPDRHLGRARVVTDTESSGGAEGALEEAYGRGRHEFYWRGARFVGKPVWERVQGVFGISSGILLHGVSLCG